MKYIYVQSLFRWAADCNVGDETAVRFTDLYDDFERDFNPLKGETQRGQFEKWLNRFKEGFIPDKKFAVFNDEVNRMIHFKRMQ